MGSPESVYICIGRSNTRGPSGWSLRVGPGEASSWNKVRLSRGAKPGSCPSGAGGCRRWYFGLAALSKSGSCRAPVGTLDGTFSPPKLRR